MAYSDGKFYARPFVPVAFGTNVGTATATASGHAVTISGVARLPKYPKRVKINVVRVAIGTAPGAALTTSKLIFKNGTDTFAVATIGTNTAGVVVDATVTASNATLADDTQPTVDFLGTSTASANTAAGVYDIWFETQEQFSSSEA